MKLINKAFTIIFLIFIGLLSCSDDEQEFPLVLPSNLSFQIEKDTATFGQVEVTANASNANFYTFYFNENGLVTTKESKDGKASHQFITDGNFPIRVRAHSTTADFIERVKYVEIGSDTTGGGNDPGIPATGYTTPLSYPNYTLVWNDEFDGNELNSANWSYEVGTGNSGWGNNELQYYRQQNLTVDNGILTIESKNEFFNNSNYTSSRIKTEGKQSFVYGRIDIRAALPEGKGMWPALWMLGDSFSTIGWPKCGEIDIMEMAGGPTTSTRGDGTVFGTAHWEDGNGVKADFSGATSLNSGKFSDEFHVFSIIWDSQKIAWYVDDIKFHEIDITPASLSEFHQKFFFIFNVAVGGNLPGSPDNSTNFPQKMYVDYVRVFQ